MEDIRPDILAADNEVCGGLAYGLRYILAYLLLVEVVLIAAS